ncbi:hypothetical protein HanXRQr2_Chr14g0649111 [Helianthus annuus]|uniref:Uncharacterized protein n=1 Tax=Helianthus annuus TaxID=4232 RepID=A0A9K3E9N0_HELAN|nr:hypothetical protein HanXRQr2_Chr14g0649111 [Helianthus annuus]
MWPLTADYNFIRCNQILNTRTQVYTRVKEITGCGQVQGRALYHPALLQRRRSWARQTRKSDIVSLTLNFPTDLPIVPRFCRLKVSGFILLT